jgi:hypothetical protein
MSDCPSAEKLAQFIDDKLADEERLAIEEHVDGCDDCRATLATLVKAATAERRASDPTLASHPPEALAATEVGTHAPRGATLAPGTALGRYVLAEVIGIGGMGVVYVARDPDLDREVAIKVLRSELSRSDPDATRRIAREAQAMARVAHPNVVPVFDVGTVNGHVFIAMERVRGTSLRAWLAAAPRTPADIVEVFLAAGRGLVAAHDAGMVHRDFKPDNVLVGNDGRARVTDFGLAFDQVPDTALETSGDSVTKPIAGTPAYMSPEQHAGANLDARSDQFSFAVALYEALYGMRPFKGASREELAAAVLDGRIESSPAGARVPRTLRAIVVRALSAKPGDRYPSLDALLKALGRDRGRTPRRVALGAVVALVIFGVAFGADWILRDRVRAITRTRFEAARAQLDRQLGLRTDAFVAQAGALFHVPIVEEIATSRDQSDFGLGDPQEDEARIERQHETLSSADWVGLIKTSPGDVLAIADGKGRIVYTSAPDASWGRDARKIPAIAAAYAAPADVTIGVVDAADDTVVASSLLGSVARKRLYVAFARGKRVGTRPSVMFVELVEATRLLDQVAIDDGTLLSVVTADGVATGQVPQEVLANAATGPLHELAFDGAWLVDREPLRARDQDAAIAELVLARRANPGLSGLFPQARYALAVLAGLAAVLAIGGLALARSRDLSRHTR